MLLNMPRPPRRSPKNKARPRRHILDAVRNSTSMADIADIANATDRTDAHVADITTPADAIEALKDGNARFFAGQSSHPDVSANERRAQIMGQTPFAAVLACSDSRVPVEIVFDQSLGHLFVVRVAGNVAGESEIGSLEYAIRHLNVRLLMILGHEGCGAVAAALSPHEQLSDEPPSFMSIINQIRPCLSEMPSIRDKKARMREAVMNNIRHQVSVLRQKEVVQIAESSGEIKVVGAFYEIGSGAVDFLIDDEDLSP